MRLRELADFAGDQSNQLDKGKCKPSDGWLATMKSLGLTIGGCRSWSSLAAQGISRRTARELLFNELTAWALVCMAYFAGFSKQQPDSAELLTHGSRRGSSHIASLGTIGETSSTGVGGPSHPAQPPQPPPAPTSSSPRSRSTDDFKDAREPINSWGAQRVPPFTVYRMKFISCSRLLP